ncbi:hypothetical protein JCM8547_006620 [Rhodosporidiobolus lusitaniae]
MSLFTSSTLDAHKMIDDRRTPSRSPSPPHLDASPAVPTSPSLLSSAASLPSRLPSFLAPTLPSFALPILPFNRSQADAYSALPTSPSSLSPVSSPERSYSPSPTPRTPSTSPSAVSAKLDSPAAWLIYYFLFNLGLTLFNKLVLNGFPFPLTLTAIHMFSGTLGTQAALHLGYFTRARLTMKENGVMVLFSLLYTISIAVSNISLELVTVPFHQVVRAMTPLFTIVLAAAFYRKRHSRETWLSLIPVVFGVVFATYGDYAFSRWGLFLTVFGTVLAAVKGLITNAVLTGRLKLDPLDLLMRMSPLAFVQCVLFAWATGELDRVHAFAATDMTQHKAAALVLNGAIAFGLNVVSFGTNKKTSALTMTVAANVKQVLTIVLAVFIFNVALNWMNSIGIVLTLAGGAWYAKIGLDEKKAQATAGTTAEDLDRLLLEVEKLG